MLHYIPKPLSWYLRITVIVYCFVSGACTGLGRPGPRVPSNRVRPKLSVPHSRDARSVFPPARQPVRLPRVRVKAPTCVVSKERLDGVPVFAPVILRHNKNSLKVLDRFIKGRDRSFVAEALKRRAQYLPTIDEVLHQYGAPLELSNVAFIESRFKPDAKSGVGAKGLWQLMSVTARRYGLRVSFWSDERTDPCKSTRAAVKHLVDLYDRFDDWMLAIGAYNSGAARMSRAINRCGTRDFFQLQSCSVLRKETKDFVMRFLAVSTIMNNRRVYGFDQL